MIALEHPEVFWGLLISWALIFWRFARVQRRAVGWIEAHVAERFRGRLTAYRAATLGRHLLAHFVLGLLLIAAAARPTLPGGGEARAATGRVLLLLDGSASMNATDPQPMGEAFDAAVEDRFDQARAIALTLVERLPGWSFGLATFSGTASIQLPMVDEPRLVAEAIAASEVHTFYRQSGSSLGQALDVALHFAGERDADLQVVVVSDGEQPVEESFEAPLEALAERAVPVHAVAVGSREGEGRLIYDMRDLVAGKEEPAVLTSYHTRRVDEHLKHIARRTGGVFTVASSRSFERLTAALEEHQGEAWRTRDPRARRDLAALPLALFFAGFLAETLWSGRRRRVGDGFDLERLGTGTAGRRGLGVPKAAAGAPRRAALRRGEAAALLLTCGALLAAGCGSTPIEQAHRENELGIARDMAFQHRAARTHYERSLAYGLRAEIPTYNLGRSATLDGDFSEAHDLYQQALELAPDLPEAHYNDGIVLYLWGEAERDPRGCQLDRTLELWRAAEGRFAAASKLRDEGAWVGAAARANRRYIRRALAEVEDLIASPPPECTPPPPPPGEGEQEGAGGGEGQEEGEGGEEGEGQGGGGGEEEGEGGGGGEGEGQGGGGGEGEEEGGESGEGEDGGEGEDEGEGGDEGEDEGQAGEDEGDQEGEGEGDDEDKGQQGQGEDEDEGGQGEGAEDEGQAGEGQGEGRQGAAGSGGGQGRGGPPLTEDELAEIREAFGRIAEQLGEEGKFFRRTLPEQFPRDAWENPDPTILW